MSCLTSAFLEHALHAQNLEQKIPFNTCMPLRRFKASAVCTQPTRRLDVLCSLIRHERMPDFGAGCFSIGGSAYVNDTDEVNLERAAVSAEATRYANAASISVGSISAVNEADAADSEAAATRAAVLGRGQFITSTLEQGLRPGSDPAERLGRKPILKRFPVLSRFQVIGGFPAAP
ncbi:hypothetical protein BDZ88DRAFT_507136 [Geranomyces variabilis]|nr:hypothetical protein BDZ88DRAFT_507136 [Geranomyces variabilis]KAJ3140622.1 hypothetical protein HDU90_007924 [Geranomyces variabilis]